MGECPDGYESCSVIRRAERAEAALTEGVGHIERLVFRIVEVENALTEALADKERYMKIAQTLQKTLDDRGC